MCLKYESSSSRIQPGEGPILVGAFSVIVKTDGSFAAAVGPSGVRTGAVI